jgi:hypothetical protein
MSILSSIPTLLKNLKLFNEFGVVSSSYVIGPLSEHSVIFEYQNIHPTVPHILTSLNTAFINNTALVISVGNITTTQMTVTFFNTSDLLTTSGQYNCLFALQV